MKFFNLSKYKKDQVEGARRVYNFSGGSNVNPDTAMQISAFNRGLIYVSSQIAKLPFHVKDSNRKILDTDPVSLLLDLSANSEMNSMMFRLVMVQGAVTHGNMIAEIERDRIGRPIALHPLKPTHWQLERDSNSNMLYYRVFNGVSDTRDAILDPRDVFHIRNFHTKDGLLGQGVVAYGSETLGISLGADKFANSLYANGGLPSGYLEHEGILSEESAQRLKEGWSDSFGGRKVGGTAVLEKGTKYVPLSHDPQVLQFLESRKFSVLEIARFLGVPPQKLYDSDSQTYNNIEHSNLEVVNDTLDAWAKLFELEADIKLLNKRRGGKHTQMNLFAVYRGDSKARSDYYKSQMQTASITPNEIRELEGRPSYDGGDNYYIASNNFTPVDMQRDLIQSQIDKNEVKENDKDQALENELNNAAIKYLNRRAK